LGENFQQGQPLRDEEAREWLERRRNDAIAELTLAVTAIAMVAAIVAAVRS
jgi:gluconate kinase